MVASSLRPEKRSVNAQILSASRCALRFKAPIGLILHAVGVLDQEVNGFLRQSF